MADGALRARELALADRLEALARITVPPAFEFLNAKARYLVAYGGRGSAKSWSICRRLLREALYRPIRVLCAREIQLSIEESVHHLIESQIAELGLSEDFDVLEKRITSRAGAAFIFAGLRSNVSKLMSMEAVDRVWIEEAASISRDSWEKLIPTIRRPGSRILVSFNPDLEDDETYKRFILNPPPDAIVRKVSWRDNPYFPEELRAEKDYLQRVDPDAYEHVWEGACRSHSDAQVFKGKYTVEPFELDADFDGPYLGADWGFSSDPTALVKAWIGGRTLYVEHEAYGLGVDIDRTPELFDQIPEARRHAIRADNARPETISYMQQHGFSELRACEKWAGCAEDGIAILRQFECIVVHPRCKHVAEEMRLYSYKVDRLSGKVLPQLSDSNNHTIDALRYALEPIIRGNGFELWTRHLAEQAGRDLADEPLPAPARGISPFGDRTGLPNRPPPRQTHVVDPTGGLLSLYNKTAHGALGLLPGGAETCIACTRPIAPGTNYVEKGAHRYHADCFDSFRAAQYV